MPLHNHQFLKYASVNSIAHNEDLMTTYAMVAGSKRPVKVGQRSYCGDFVFEGDSLTEVNFAGGYFDGEGRPHFRHADWQGNVAIVTDRDGQIEQHNGYYPYGEPWREPSGQNRLFGGKERMRDGGLNDYDYVARRLNSATGIWAQPDPMARDFAGTNPYVFCAANPIKFIDPTGCALQIFGDDAKSALAQLRETAKGLTLSISDDGAVSYSLTPKGKLNENAEKLKKIIDDKNISVNVTAQKSSDMSDGTFFIGGSFMGNEYDDETGRVNTAQTVCPTELAQMDKADGKKGKNIMHEVTESYEGGKMALENKKGDSTPGETNSYYPDAHAKATPQTPMLPEVFHRIDDTTTRVEWRAGTIGKSCSVKSKVIKCTIWDAHEYLKQYLN